MGKKSLSAIMTLGLVMSMSSTNVSFINSINNFSDNKFKYGKGKATTRKKHGSKNKKKF